MPTPTKGPRLGGGPSHERMIIANLARALFAEGRIRTATDIAEQILGLVFELVEIGAGGKLLGCHKASVLNAGGPQAGQQGDNRAMLRSVGWTQSFARTRVRPKRVRRMASARQPVKRGRADGRMGRR